MSQHPGRNGALDVTPSARRLTSSLRDIGYDFVSALADIVDNSVTAGAATVQVEFFFDGIRSHVAICDDGAGMSTSGLTEALRFGTRREYELGELGRYGLGLKTASISQCRRVTVATRRAVQHRRVASLSLDLDHVAATDRWEIVAPPEDSAIGDYLAWLDDGPGTVVLWEGLDRVLPESRPEGGWAKRRLDLLAMKASAYLGMVFHRFLERATSRETPLTITVNGEKVRPWNPFAPMEDHTEELPVQSFEVEVGAACGRVTLRRFILPPRSSFSSVEEFERLSGPLKWNRQQGLYVYRADRLVQGGGWCGLRAADEHTKFARAAVDFQTDLDGAFQINVAKMRVLLPAEIRTLLERPVNELTRRADAIYRRETQRDAVIEPAPSDREAQGSPVSGRAADLGAALMSAALDAGEYEALDRIMDRLRSSDPGLAAAIGW